MSPKRIYQPISALKLGPFLLALPFALAFLCALKILSYFVKVTPSELGKLPPNALLYGTHLDVFSACLSPNFHDPSMIVIGYDGFLPSLYIPWDHLVGISHLCYRRDSSTPPLDQLLNMFTQHAGHRFWIFTDSGGPYGRVRKSLVILSVESQRPVVAMKLTPSRYFRILEHRIPLPFSRITVKFSPPIPHETLAMLSRDAARERLQAAVDAL